eukprot:TRINITY_DN135_c1_g1_i25.p1 TRINITY_DN135_c1_g1~~TRINITY_DN135_c1_g1_i25.p1  ORF type:complete len:288 (-),score=28.49 TRINITY_DN135_c1_g1_i25:1189-2052(-)
MADSSELRNNKVEETKQALETETLDLRTFLGNLYIELNATLEDDEFAQLEKEFGRFCKTVRDLAVLVRDQDAWGRIAPKIDPMVEVKIREKLAITKGKYTYANQNRRCFVIEGATLSVGLKQFQADLLVDSGASFELELPFSKVVQFGLVETNSESGDAAFEKFTVHYLFPDVTVTLPTTDGREISKNLTAVYSQTGENRPPKIRQTLEQQPPPANTTTSPVIQLSPIKQGSEKYELPTLGFIGLVRLGLEINFRTNTLTLGKMIFKSHGYANRISTPIAKLDFGTK